METKFISTQSSMPHNQHHTFDIHHLHCTQYICLCMIIKFIRVSYGLWPTTLVQRSWSTKCVYSVRYGQHLNISKFKDYYLLELIDWKILHSFKISHSYWCFAVDHFDYAIGFQICFCFIECVFRVVYFISDVMYLLFIFIWHNRFNSIYLIQ